MHLDARAIHLPFECDLTRKSLERLIDVVRRLREHRCDGRHHLELETLQSRRAGFESRPRDGAEIAFVHGGAPHFRQRHAGDGRDRVDHDADERALPQLAHQQPHQKLLLLAGCAPEQRLQGSRASRARAAAANRRQFLEQAIDFDDVKAWSGRGVRRTGTQRRWTDADTPLADFA